ncbi:MAG: GAF domain-containing sensor histidine kinase [Chloroflexi bacterium]|nr:GAF domain-containing sensor histidine kinase [Chloroflexota bacterium]
MANLAMLKKMVCVLSCQPRNMTFQLPAALDCLRSSVGARAAGIDWRGENGIFRPRELRPTRFRLDDATRRAIRARGALAHPVWGQTQVAWLAVPMKVGGTVEGRLWIVAPGGTEFDQNDREFIMMAGNQLALAQENARLFEEAQHLAARRGELLRRIIATQDERCRRISRELHDEISQSLTAMALDLEAVQLAHGKSDAAIARLGDLRPRLLAALDEVNRIILDLRPALLEDLGLVAALRWYASQRLEPAGVAVHTRIGKIESRMQPHVETTLYRVAQEALTNIGKHSRAKNVWLSITRANNHFTLTVRDDGCGFDVNAVQSHPDDRVGIGLFGMKERANLVGGRFAIQSAPDQGTRITVRIPAELELTDGNDSSLAG